MDSNFDTLRKYWNLSGQPVCASEQDLILFEESTQLTIPEDLKVYFKTLNGSQGTWDDQLFEFYPFDDFTTVKDRVGDYDGVPCPSKSVTWMPS